MKLKYKGIIFDLDGTLADSLEDIAVSVNKALQLRGFPELKIEEYRDKVGWGINRLVFLALPENSRCEETAALIAADSSAFYAENPLVYTRLYPGVSELIETLMKMDIKTAVLTNKPNPVAQKVIAGLFPPGSFNIIQGEISGKPRKPDPACVWELLVKMNLTPADVIFAGDSEVDIKTTLSSGCFPLGVSWGYRSRKVITEAGARHIIDKPQEIFSFLL